MKNSEIMTLCRQYTLFSRTVSFSIGNACHLNQWQSICECDALFGIITKVAAEMIWLFSRLERRMLLEYGLVWADEL